MEDEQPHQELVKCVLVGDNAVGKTRLTCAKANRQHCSLPQLLNPHVPTVWAIDQYRIYKEVLQNSWTVIDGVNVTLRLWDTFGDHHKDRRFAYARSDVILMCFDVGRISSLRNCREMWYDQIRRFCPNTPVILVGCKNDIRFIYRKPEYYNHCRDKSPLVRQVREADLVMPDQARAVAKELGLPYFETSVLTYYGVEEVFENAIRAALCVRRAQRFWIANLRRVMRPKLQEPYCPPRPDMPSVEVKKSKFNEDLVKMIDHQIQPDIVFLCDGVGFTAHRFMLCASSPLLLRILTSADCHDQQLSTTRSNSETSLMSSNFGGGGSNILCNDYFNDDTELLISQSDTGSPSHRPPPAAAGCTVGAHPPDSLTASSTASLVISPWLCAGRASSFLHLHQPTNMLHCLSHGGVRPMSKPNQRRGRGIPASCKLQPQLSPQKIATTASPKLLVTDAESNQAPPSLPHSAAVFRNLNYPAFHSMRIEQCHTFDMNGRLVTLDQTVLTCSKLIVPQAMTQVLQFLYRGCVDFRQCTSYDLKQAAEFLDIPDLYHFVVNRIKSSRNLSQVGLETSILKPIQLRGLSEVCLNEGLLADVTIKLDDGVLTAHKALLMARCDMMFAMFSHNDFREKVTNVVHFPGISKLTFGQLLHYLYTDRVTSDRASTEGISGGVSPENCVDLIELANRLCLPHLVTLVEKSVVQQMTELREEGVDLSEVSLAIFEECQIHSANQLSDWCMNYLAQNYNAICRKFPKVLRNLLPENQAALNLNRWPPVWYLKDYDFYEHLVMDREREERPKSLKRSRSNSAGGGTGCLCFSSKSSKV